MPRFSLNQQADWQLRQLSLNHESDIAVWEKPDKGSISKFPSSFFSPSSSSSLPLLSNTKDGVSKGSDQLGEPSEQRGTKAQRREASLRSRRTSGGSRWGWRWWTRRCSRCSTCLRSCWSSLASTSMSLLHLLSPQLALICRQG